MQKSRTRRPKATSWGGGDERFWEIMDDAGDRRPVGRRFPRWPFGFGCWHGRFVNPHDLVEDSKIVAPGEILKESGDLRRRAKTIPSLAIRARMLAWPLWESARPCRRLQDRGTRRNSEGIRRPPASGEDDSLACRFGPVCRHGRFRNPYGLVEDSKTVAPRTL